MKKFLLALVIVVVAAMSAVVYAEQADDVSLGKVRMRNEKLDKKARNEVTAIAAKIKKQRKFGVIKVKGDFPGAANAEEYLSKSVFMAREVEKYLASLLSKKFQVFVTASGYSGLKGAGDNSVEILLYPYELKLEELESLRYVSSQANPLTEPQTEPAQPAQPAEAVEAGSMLSPSREDTDYPVPSSRREREKRNSEDASLANELVKKAKARAAEKAKRKASGD